MDVRIGYSVDLENVPDKIADMLSELSLHKDDSRKALSDVDRRLNEAHSILVGFSEAKKQLEPNDLDATGDEDVD